MLSTFALGAVFTLSWLLAGAVTFFAVPPPKMASNSSLEGVVTVNGVIDDPATLGADLVVACAAAQSMYSTPCVVISMGTATAMFVVDSNRRMLGGTIAPGVSISLDALTANGALLPAIALNAPKNIIGKNTDDSIRSGVVMGTACMLDGMIDKFEKELGEKCTIIATGGIAPMIVNNCSHDIILKDDLILEGLRIIYEKNQ